jgi:hypothetical protein
MPRPVAELDLQRAREAQVELLLLVVEMLTRLIAGRHDDGVDAERRDPELLAHLAKAVPLAHLVERGDGVALAARGHSSCRSRRA